MHDQFKRQAEQFLNAAKDARIPENLQAFAVDSVSKSRVAFDKLSTVARDQAQVAEELAIAPQAGARSSGGKLSMLLRKNSVCSSNRWVSSSARSETAPVRASEEKMVTSLGFPPVRICRARPCSGNST